MKLQWWLGICIFLAVFTADAKPQLIFGRIPGVTNEIAEQVVKAAYQRIGISVDTTVLPPERSLLNSNQGLSDGEISRVAGLEKIYPNLIMIPVAVSSFDGVVFTKKTEFKVNGWNSLKQYSLCIRLGVKFAQQGTQGMKVVAVQSIDQCFKMLNNGRIDLVVESRDDGLYTIKKLKLQGIHVLEPPLETTNLYHYLHKKHMDLVPRVTKALTEMESEGRIKEIRKKTLENF